MRLQIGTPRREMCTRLEEGRVEQRLVRVKVRVRVRVKTRVRVRG